MGTGPGPEGTDPPWLFSGRAQGSILIVDDRASNLVALGALLEPLGRRIVAATSGAQALRHLLDEEFAVILLDVQMPEMDGFETARYIRARPKTRAIPIVFVTANSMESEHVFRGYQEGAVDYILKPVDPTILKGKVSIFVELYEANVALRRHSELQAVHASLALAQRAGESGMWDMDLVHRRLHWSPEYADLCGLSESPGDDLDGWLMTVDPRDRARVSARVNAVLEQHDDWDEEFRVVHPARGTRWIASRGKVYRGTSGAPERFTGIAFDISERRLANERMSQLQRATATLSSAITAADVIGELVECGRRLARADGAWLAMRDRQDGSIVVKGTSGTNPHGPWVEHYAQMTALAQKALLTGLPETTTCDAERHLVLPLVSEGAAHGALGLLTSDAAATELEVSVELLTLGSLGAQALERARLHQSEQDARTREVLLAEVSAELEASLGLDARLERLASLLVPRLADGCTLEIDVAEGSPARRVVAASTEALETVLHAIHERDSGLAEREGSLRWARQNDAALLTVPVAPLLEEYLRTTDAAGESARQMGRPPVSAIVAPIRARQRSIGAMSLVSFDPERAYGQDDLRLVDEIGRRAGLALDNARLYEAQVEVASTLQRSLLPRHLPPIPRVSLAARYLAAGAHTEAGGDWFEAVALPEDRVVLAVGDVVGRGTDAAAVMGQLRSAMRAYALQGLPPSGIVEEINRFADGVPGAAVSTMVCAELDIRRRELRYTCAGHPPPLVAGPNGRAIFLLDGRGPPLASGHENYNEGITALTPDDTLVLYSDGAIERRGERIDHGLVRLARLVSYHVREAPGDLADSVIAELFGTTPAAADDVAVLVARFEAAPQPFHLVVPAEVGRLAGVRREMRAWLSAARIDASLANDLVLSAMEACANAVEHGGVSAGGTPVELTMQHIPSTETIEVEVRDRGRWREPPAEAGTRGHGIRIMRKLMESVDIDPTDAGTVLRMRTPARYAISAVRLASSEPILSHETLNRSAAIDLTLSDGRLTGRLRGDIDDVAIADLRKRLDVPISTCNECVFDVTDVSYFGSTAVSLLFQTSSTLRSRGKRLVLISPLQTVVRKVLDLCGLGAVAIIVNDEAATFTTTDVTAPVATDCDVAVSS